MSALFEYDELTAPGVIDFLEPNYLTTVWHPGAEGHWQPCVRITVDGRSYYDWVDDGFDAGEPVDVTVRRRRLRFSRSWIVIDGRFGNYKLQLRPIA